MLTTLLAPLLLLLVGMGLALLGLFLFQRKRDLIANGVQTQGLVVSLHQDSEGLYAPVFQFQTMTGETVRFVSSVFSDPPEFRIGQMVPLAYDPARPQRVALMHQSSYMVVFLLSGMGLTIMAVGVLVWVVAR